MADPKLAIVKEQEEKPKRKREQIVLIETPPKPEWLSLRENRVGLSGISGSA